MEYIFQVEGQWLQHDSLKNGWLWGIQNLWTHPYSRFQNACSTSSHLLTKNKIIFFVPLNYFLVKRYHWRNKKARPISLRKVAWPIWIICDPFLDFLILRRSAPVGLSVPGAHCLCVVKRPNGRNQVEVGFGDCDHFADEGWVCSWLLLWFFLAWQRFSEFVSRVDCANVAWFLKDQETFQTCSLSWKASLRWDPT